MRMAKAVNGVPPSAEKMQKCSRIPTANSNRLMRPINWRGVNWRLTISAFSAFRMCATTAWLC